jgi:hypothetical protein
MVAESERCLKLPISRPTEFRASDIPQVSPTSGAAAFCHNVNFVNVLAMVLHLSMVPAVNRTSCNI